MPGPFLFGGDDGGEHASIAIGGEHGGVGLACDAPGLKLEGPLTPFDLYGVFIEHGGFPVGVD